MNRKVLIFGVMIFLAVIVYWLMTKTARQGGGSPDLSQAPPLEEYVIGKDIPLEEIDYFLISESGMSRFGMYSFELRKEGEKAEMQAYYFSEMGEGGEEIEKKCMLTPEQWRELTLFFEGERLRYQPSSGPEHPVLDQTQRSLSLRWKGMTEQQREMILSFKDEERLEKLRQWLIETADRTEGIE
ncbi:MAG: hypothetical protein Q4A78_03025 [Peptostreptococcaceae bacterium]|nr:hypothetical protein [Peptostreptococcaceae bacterium]